MTVFEWFVVAIFAGGIGLAWWNFNAWTIRSSLAKWDKEREKDSLSLKPKPEEILK